MERLRNLPRPETTTPRLLILTACIFTFVISSCSSTPAQQPSSDRVAPGARNAVHASPRPPAKTSSTEDRLRAKVRQWEGTPHRMGGTGRRGFDCSGFVQRMYRELFNLRLPRSTAKQVRVGTTIAKKELRTGDLVFFHPPNKIRHVGIYLNNGEFAHASAKRGVTISQLNSPYWRKSYWTAKRVLTDPS